MLTPVADMVGRAVDPAVCWLEDGGAGAPGRLLAHVVDRSLCRFTHLEGRFPVSIVRQAHVEAMQQNAFELGRDAGRISAGLPTVGRRPSHLHPVD